MPGTAILSVAGETSRYHKFALSFRQSGEQKAQSCEIACSRQLISTVENRGMVEVGAKRLSGSQDWKLLCLIRITDRRLR